jgi:hypothetical protein
MRLAFSFRQTMSGSYWRLDAPTEEGAVAVTLRAEAPDVRQLAKRRVLRVGGLIDAEHLASGQALEGVLSLELVRERRIAYRFAFEGDDGRRYDLSAIAEWSKVSPIESLTLLPATFYDDREVEFARATLHFDLRADWASWLGSFRLRWGA